MRRSFVSAASRARVCLWSWDWEDKVSRDRVFKAQSSVDSAMRERNWLRSARRAARREVMKVSNFRVNFDMCFWRESKEMVIEGRGSDDGIVEVVGGVVRSIFDKEEEKDEGGSMVD